MLNLRLLILTAGLAAAAVHVALHDSDSTLELLLRRQAPGTPQYACHENCGNTIAFGRNPNHCDNSTWTAAYEACLECALEFDIWRFYSNGVTNAAQACGLSPTPSPSGGAVSPSSTVSHASTTSSEPSSTAPAETSGSAGITTDAPTTAPPSTGTGAGVSTPPPTTSPVTAGAPEFSIHSTMPLLSVGSLVAIFVAFLGAW
ncbi:hypothetical protein N656DRAFT_766780 [Canariomyces notabilis]|uniref:Uncharacterized protein n=1 Tax=Canariomyces notabilis TaxID=2074819 RepID=A0AAN6YUK5_9PEZI|nr:hypothetical protein N656DRAFT_766780 [Canariomyces arenarius]